TGCSASTSTACGDRGSPRRERPARRGPWPTGAGRPTTGSPGRRGRYAGAAPRHASSCAGPSQCLAEHARRPEHEHDNEHGEGEDVLPLAAEHGRPPVLEAAEEEATDQRTA